MLNSPATKWLKEEGKKKFQGRVFGLVTQVLKFPVHHKTMLKFRHKEMFVVLEKLG